jgi:3-hydroxyisobutyrate dehydrogenase-like beta-hydroxyacid dehydrogenase
VDGTAAGRPDIAMVGFGEAAQAFRSGWTLGDGGRVRAFDVKSLDPAEAAGMAERYRAHGVAGGPDRAAALAGAAAVFSLVTPDQALAAAEAAAPHLHAGALWLDGNSCSPGTKRAAAALVEAAGGVYVDMAIMAPVHPRRHRTPVLLSGPGAASAARHLARLDMRPALAGDRVGDASTIKMLRSVMVKGLEALTAECLLAARRAGVDAAVLGSLQASDPGFDWERRAGYGLERMMVHGVRRAAEMREVAATLRELGLPDRLSAAAAVWQAEIGALALDAGEPDFAARADRILAARGTGPR